MPRVGTLPSRALALALVVVVVVLFVVAVLAPLANRYFASREAIEERTTQLARLERVAARAPYLQEALDELRDDPQSRRLLLVEDSPTLAAASMQERLKVVVERHGGRLTSTQVMAPSQQGGYAKVAVAARVSGGTAALQRTLHELESAVPLLTVDDLTILSRRSRRRNAQNNVRLDIRFTLYGYMVVANGADS